MRIPIPPSSEEREMLYRLRQFDGNRCLWRPIAGTCLVGAATLFPVAGGVADFYIVAQDATFARVVLGVVVALLLAAAARQMWKRQPWRSLIANRLWSYERLSSGVARLSVLVELADLDRAALALRGAKLNPATQRRIGTPPENAPSLNGEIVVYRPDAWHEPTDDEGYKEQVKQVFTAAGIRARVAGDDVPASQSPLPVPS